MPLSSRRHSLPGSLILVLAFLLTGAWGPCLRAQTLPAQGDARLFWTVTPGADHTLDIFQRSNADAADPLHKVRTERGKLAREGIAAADGRLWLVYENLLVQSLNPVSPQPGLTFYEARVEAPLPQGLNLLALTAGGDTLWALARVEDPTAFQRGFSLASGKKPATLPAQSPSTLPPAPAAGTDVLLRLDRTQWTRATLPSDWPHGAQAWLILLREDASEPVLAALPRSVSAKEPAALQLYRPRPRKTAPAHDAPVAWERQDYHLPAIGTLRLTSLEDQLILGQRVAQKQGIALELSLLRPEGLVGLGKLTVRDAPESANWTLTRAGTGVALVVAPAADRLVWTRMNVRGQLLTDSLPLDVETPNLLLHWSQQFFPVVMLALATLIMFFSWKRDVAGNRPRLPANLRLADLGPRALGGLIDFAPCLFSAILITGADARDVLTHWPGSLAPAAGWHTVIASSLTIGLLILYTTLAELFTARTLGKLLTGQRVTNLQGGPPHLWQVLARNVVRTLELFSPLLLILIFLTPTRQRLGDMLARTLVVQPARPDENQPGPDEEE